MIPAPEAALIAAAGVVAGIVGSAGGITSLISYPALLAVGIPAFPANVANNVSVTACWPGSALASRPELQGTASLLRRWAWVTAVGGAIGAVLLLSTPPGAFSRVVPFLVAAGALTLLLQPRLSALRGRQAHASTPILVAGLLLVSVYSGYFGAGSGVMTLSLLLFTVDQNLARANALKNMLVGAATITSAVLFAVFAHVDWTAVAPLAAGTFAGSLVGPRVARRLPPALLRWLVAFTGLALAARLWIDPGG